MQQAQDFTSSQTASLNSDSDAGGYYSFIINGAADGEQPRPLDLSEADCYRNREDADYSPSIESASSASPWLTAGDGDEFGSQSFDSLPDDTLSQYFQDTGFDESSLNDKPSNANTFQDLPILDHSSFQPSFLPALYGFDGLTFTSGHQMPSEDPSTSPDSSHVPVNSGNGDYFSHMDVPPSSAPPHAQSGPRYQRTRSEPSSQRPFMPFQGNGFSDVFFPDPTADPVVVDELFSGYTIDGVPISETRLVSLGPKHQVSRRDFLSLPKFGHGRTKSASETHGTESGSKLISSSDSPDFLGRQRLASQRSAPALRSEFASQPVSPQTVNAPPSPVTSPVTSPVITYPDDRGNFIWHTLSSSQSAFSSSSAGSISQSTPDSLNGFEDDGERQSKLEDDGTEELPTSSHIVKHSVTSRAMRIASNARMRSHARFSCPHCPQSLTTKGGLRNHVNSHFGIKQFRCSAPDCRKSFVTKWVCTRHERTVHGLSV